MMETDQPAASENPEQQGDEQGGAAGASPVRSYECTFCKRGFSNAQALGGHMNIHRRDKAKLKQSSSSQTDNQQSFDIISKINFPSSYNYPNHPAMDAAATAAKTSASQEIIRSSTPGKWPWVIQDDVDDVNKRSDKSSQHVGEIKQLPLFDEKPSTTDQNYPTTAQVQEKGFSSSSRQSLSGSDQLDLELRLGPEPQDSSPTMTTKKFF